MNKFLALLVFTSVTFAQKTDVAELELTINPASAEELFYSFAQGDKILLTVESENGTIDEMAVAEYPDNYKYRGRDIKKDRNREFTVTTASVYKFRFVNNAHEARSCYVKIQRISASKETKSFTTAVKWITVQDTVWTSMTKEVVAGYDTLNIHKTRKVVAFDKKYEEPVLDKTQRVGAATMPGDSRVSVAFGLPANYIAKEETKKVIAWAYWVGVGEESNEFWKQNRKLIVGAVQGATTIFTSPLGGIAAGLATNMVLPTNGEDVEYALLNEPNSKLFIDDKEYRSFDDGKGIAAYKRITDTAMLQGKFYIALANDNYVQPIDVNIKVSAIIEHIKYKDEKYIDKVITPRYEKKIVSEPQIITRTIPVPLH